MSALKDMKQPTTAEHLQQLVHAMNWMRSSVRHYAHHVKPLLDVLEKAYTRNGKRTTKGLRRFLLTPELGLTTTC
jgi:hypothetical protein